MSLARRSPFLNYFYDNREIPSPLCFQIPRFRRLGFTSLEAMLRALLKSGVGGNFKICSEKDK
jgi:hypothetical protein